MKKNSLFMHLFSLLTTGSTFGNLLFIQGIAVGQSTTIETQNAIQYSDRGNRMEGLNPPTDVAGADVQIRAVFTLPFLPGEITEGDSVYLFFNPGGQATFDVSVSELKTNYLMKPHPGEVEDGEFIWSAADVLTGLARQFGIKYDNLLPLALTPESTPRLARVAPIQLSTSKAEFEFEGYRFICISNADFEAIFTIQFDGLIVHRGYLRERAGNLFAIEWDGMNKGKAVDAGEFVLHLRGETTSKGIHQNIETDFFFHHDANRRDN